jgi:hypothetical protein
MNIGYKFWNNNISRQRKEEQTNRKQRRIFKLTGINA